MTGASIEVSVIIPAYRDWAALPRCLEALERQAGGIAFETIVVASGSEAGESPLAAGFPSTRFLLFAERKFPGVARNLGAREARGDILLFVDADCELAPDGLTRVVESHRRYAAPLIGGAIDQAEPANGAAWGYHFASFAPWLPRRSEQPIPVADLATPCCSVKRWAFERFGPFSESRYCEDTLLCWHILEAGFAVLFDPAIWVRHHGLDALALVLSRKFKHGRAFAEMRGDARRWPVARRRLQGLAAPLVPFVLLYRIGREVFRSGAYRRGFVLSLPFTGAAVLAWTLGEWLGLWFPRAD
ncbi:glycosyltransferase family 2 protein [Methylomagnum sp.]